MVNIKKIILMHEDDGCRYEDIIEESDRKR